VKHQRGFTLVEMLLAILIAGTGMAAVMALMPQLISTAETSHDIAAAVGLAQLLIEEIDLVPWEDPADNCTYGLEPDENDANRVDFDDVDDYDGYTDQPPRDRNGNPDSNYTEYKRRVQVVKVDQDDLTTIIEDGGSTDVKRIVVTVTRAGRELVRLTVLRFFGGNRADAPLLEEKITSTAISNQ